MGRIAGRGRGLSRKTTLGRGERVSGPAGHRVLGVGVPLAEQDQVREGSLSHSLEEVLRGPLPELVQGTGALVGAVGLPEEALAVLADVVQHLEDSRQADLFRRVSEAKAAIAAALALQQAGSRQGLQDLAQEGGRDVELVGEFAGELVGVSVRLLGEPDWQD